MSTRVSATSRLLAAASNPRTRQPSCTSATQARSPKARCWSSVILPPSSSTYRIERSTSPGTGRWPAPPRARARRPGRPGRRGRRTSAGEPSRARRSAGPAARRRHRPGVGVVVRGGRGEPLDRTPGGRTGARRPGGLGPGRGHRRLRRPGPGRQTGRPPTNVGDRPGGVDQPGRTAPEYGIEFTGAVVTPLPGLAACTIMPLPMYMPTWLTGL